MPSPLRKKMEHAFQEDFSQVKIHPNAPDADSLSALAFTQGKDIHFAPGHYNPQSQEGQKIIAHELAHVVQQRSGRVNLAQGQSTPVNNHPSLEAEADRMGAKAARGMSVSFPASQHVSESTAHMSTATPIQRTLGGMSPVALDDEENESTNNYEMTDPNAELKKAKAHMQGNIEWLKNRAYGPRKERLGFRNDPIRRQYNLGMFISEEKAKFKSKVKGYSAPSMVPEGFVGEADDPWANVQGAEPSEWAEEERDGALKDPLEGVNNQQKDEAGKKGIQPETGSSYVASQVNQREERAQKAQKCPLCGKPK